MVGLEPCPVPAEVIVPEKLLYPESADQAAVERAAVASGMVTMFETGIEAALDGMTTIEEVVRSLRVDA